jgi:hypothetical protein
MINEKNNLGSQVKIFGKLFDENQLISGGYSLPRNLPQEI